MVFESLITDLLNKYLGDYIENLDKSQLKLSLWGGDVKLENLDIKANAFDDLDLPIRVMQGHLGLLTLKIPWKHLYTEPWIVELDGLYVLAVPNMAIKYNEEKDMKYQFESKMKELRKIEEAKQRKAEAKGAKDEEKDSFGLKLGMQILKNLQMRIRNIHIRYEDAFSNPSRPHSTGITLHNLSLQTTDSSWNPCTIKDNVKNFHKLIQLDCLALYWNSKTKMYNDMKRGLLKNTMKSHIASPDNPKVTDYNHIIRPISSTGKLIINMKPEQTAFSEPMFWVDLIMNEMKFALSRSQYIDITSTLSGVNRMVTQSKYLKYRPEQELNKSSKETLRLWWKFAYNVVLHETVRRRRRMWSWNHMKNHRALCKQYIEVYARQLQGKSLYAEEKKMVVEAEHNLDVFNLTLCRQRAELQHLRTKQMKKHEREKKGGGWFSGWWGGSKAAAEGQDKDRKSLTEKFEAEMTSEEKMKLYSVLDYEEHGVEAIDYPKDFVLTTVRFQLFKFGFSLYDEELPHPRIMKTSVNALFTSINMRPVNDGISVSVTVDSMVVLGCKQDEGMAKLVSSQLIDPGGSEGEGESANLLKISFEQHPLSGDCDNRIQVNARPLEIIYDAATINHIAKFFQAPDDVRLDELSSAVMNSLEEMKEMTATGLKYLAQKRMYTDIHVDIKPSYFILPDTGVFKKGCRMLLVDLGSVCVDSERPAELDEKEILSGESMDFDKVKERAYDLFNVTLQSMQVLYIDKGEDWQSIRKKSESKSHILRPFGFHVLLKKCIIATDIRLPNFVITGDLPILALDVSGFILKNVIEIMLHIPWPENKKSEEMTEEEKKILTILKNQEDLYDDVSEDGKHHIFGCVA